MLNLSTKPDAADAQSEAVTRARLDGIERNT
jgi:hypothetical protein